MIQNLPLFALIVPDLWSGFLFGNSILMGVF